MVGLAAETAEAGEQERKRRVRHQQDTHVVHGRDVTTFCTQRGLCFPQCIMESSDQPLVTNQTSAIFNFARVGTGFTGRI